MYQNWLQAHKAPERVGISERIDTVVQGSCKSSIPAEQIPNLHAVGPGTKHMLLFYTR